MIGNVMPGMSYMLGASERRMVDELARRARELLGDAVDRIVLFGSRARGEADRESDIDVLVLLRVPPAQVPPLRRALRDIASEIELAEVEESSAPLAVLVLASDNFERLRRRERRIALDVEAEGLPL